MLLTAKSATGVPWLILVALCAMASSSVNAFSGFDLNEALVNDDEQVSAVTNNPVSPVDSKQAQVEKRKNARSITPAFYAKVTSLFKVLQICDADLDFDSMKLPEDFSAQTKAMMALEKVVKSNLIKKSDKPKYRRIMENCRKISDLIATSKEKSMSLDSQTSGGTYEDRMARQMYEMAHSVLDGMRDRFAGFTNKNQPPAAKPKLPVVQPDSATANSEDHLPVMKLDDGNLASRPTNTARSFFTFF